MDTLRLISDLMTLRHELVADGLVVAAYKVEAKIQELIEGIQP